MENVPISIDGVRHSGSARWMNIAIQEVGAQLYLLAHNQVIVPSIRTVQLMACAPQVKDASLTGIVLRILFVHLPYFAIHPPCVNLVGIARAARGVLVEHANADKGDEQLTLKDYNMFTQGVYHF